MQIIGLWLTFGIMFVVTLNGNAQEAPQPAREMTTRELAEKIQTGIVRIETLYIVDAEEVEGEGASAKRVTTQKSYTNTGTGFLIPGGFIVTNHHVVSVSLKPGEKLREFLGYRGTVAFDVRPPDPMRSAVRKRSNPFAAPAPVEDVAPEECMRFMVWLELVNKDELADLAVLRPQPEWPTLGTALSPLSEFHHYALSFAPPWETQVGDEVVAIGFARSLAGPPTLTKGIVSALDRELVDQYSFTDLIQTDAAINPGNSGGPLIDMRGRVVGINTYSLNHVGTPGIGFARSTRTLIPMVQMLQQGPLRRPDLGIETHNLSPADNDVLGLAPGLLILDVKQGLPAQRAGVQPGDLLVRVGAQRVARPGDLHNALALVGEEKSLSLVVWRLPTSAIRNLAEGEAGIQRLEMTRALHPYGAIDLKSIRKLNLWAELE